MNPINEYGTASDTLTPGRFNLEGQRQPDYIVGLKQAASSAWREYIAKVDEWEAVSEKSFTPELKGKADGLYAEALNLREEATQADEAVSLALAEERHNRQTWGTQTAIDEKLDYITEA